MQRKSSFGVVKRKKGKIEQYVAFEYLVISC